METTLRTGQDRGLLISLSNQDNNISSEMKNVFAITEKLKADHQHMIEEHNSIVIASASDNLIEMAKKEYKTEFMQFAKKLMLHAKTSY